MRQPKDYLGKRKHHRVSINRPAFIYTDPDGYGLECIVEDISHGGACIFVGDMSIKKMFVLQMTPTVRRLCKIVWRSGERIGAEFVRNKKRPQPEPTQPKKASPMRRAALDVEMSF